MLKKLVTIKNVGRFKGFNASGDVELKRHSLLFAENGRGKTTICTILRSLQSGVGAHVIGRTTLGSIDAPEIRILSDDSTLIFSNGTWNNTLPDIAIFDSTFVSENVFSGNVVSIGHKRNLYRVIVGRDGVALAKAIESLDDASRAKAAEIREKAAQIQAHVRGMSLGTFLSLEKDPEVDEKLRARVSELDAFRQAEPIRTRPALSALRMPALPVGIAELLGRTVEGIAKNAETQVTAQIEAHAMHNRGQAWLSEGIGYVRNNRCPFCNQVLATATDLISAYRAFFSQGYSELRGAIAAMRTSLDDALGDRQIASLERTMEQNVGDCPKTC